MKFIVDNEVVIRKNKIWNDTVQNFLPNGVETALSEGYGLYQVKPSGDVYIYSPVWFNSDLEWVWEQIRGKIFILKKPDIISKKSLKVYNEQLKKIGAIFDKELPLKMQVHNLVDAIMEKSNHKK
jgi:hypothetical protein